MTDDFAVVLHPAGGDYILTVVRPTAFISVNLADWEVRNLGAQIARHLEARPPAPPATPGRKGRRRIAALESVIKT